MFLGTRYHGNMPETGANVLINLPLFPLSRSLSLSLSFSSSLSLAYISPTYTHHPPLVLYFQLFHSVRLLTVLPSSLRGESMTERMRKCMSMKKIVCV